jgi:hypothetical protein
VGLVESELGEEDCGEDVKSGGEINGSLDSEGKSGKGNEDFLH